MNDCFCFTLELSAISLKCNYVYICLNAESLEEEAVEMMQADRMNTEFMNRMNDIN